jgi:hypothetical protein
MWNTLIILLINFAKELVMVKNEIPVTVKTLLIVLVSLTVFLLGQSGCLPISFKAEGVDLEVTQPATEDKEADNVQN